jgi:hypothetical protein
MSLFHKLEPETIPEMEGGRVVPTFDSTIKKCGYCNRNLEWKVEHKGGSAASWESERKKIASGEYMVLLFGPPRDLWTYGCPLYGKDSSGNYEERKSALGSLLPWKSSNGTSLGWHFHWWQKESYDYIWDALREGANNATS